MKSYWGLGKVTGTVESHRLPASCLALLKQGRAVVTCTAKEIERHSKVFGRQPAFLGQALGRQIISIAVDRHLAHLDQALANATAQIRVGKSKSNREIVRQLTLSRSIDVSALRTMLGIATLLRLDFAPPPRSSSSHDNIG